MLKTHLTILSTTYTKHNRRNSICALFVFVWKSRTRPISPCFRENMIFRNGNLLSLRGNDVRSNVKPISRLKIILYTARTNNNISAVMYIIPSVRFCSKAGDAPSGRGNVKPGWKLIDVHTFLSTAPGSPVSPIVIIFKRGRTTTIFIFQNAVSYRDLWSITKHHNFLWSICFRISTEFGSDINWLLGRQLSTN